MNLGGIVVEGADELKLLVASWNEGNAKPPKLLDPLIPHCGKIWDTSKETYDIVVVGAQECTYSDSDDEDDEDDEEYQQRFSSRANAQEKMSKGHFVALVETQLGPDYHTVTAVNLWQMRLIVMVHNTHKDHVSEVEKTKEGTGLGNVLGNKGGVLAKMNIYNTSLCFVSCHLAAHEAEKFHKARNEDCHEIMDGCRVGKASLDLASQYHHAFWFGDLNYRIDLSDVDQKERTHAEHHAEVVEMIKNRKWKALFEADGLKEAQDKKQALVGWTAATPEWAPTFKVERGHEECVYKKQRIPSYCDR
jgi:hypothetical protein